MEQLPYLADRAEVSDAAELIRLYGDDAGFQAAARADRSRDLGNHIHFCRWRQIERLIVLLASERPVGAIH
ncbi:MULTISPECIES: hypothetical protein [unclassified Sphingosinithalassobacter]|uniref:hypothetical protein n=1 Tax=unclassified Sphingosinithalassobacter TaxID=2676235 RepID=UPI00165E0FD6|nr:hypothetical protein [Sphingosinithalassobacter sp. CS137]